MNLDRLWIHSVIRLMDEELGAEERGRLLERCGRGCAMGCGIIDGIKQAGIAGAGLDEAFEKLKGPSLFADRIIRTEDGFITTCPECYCPFVKDNLEEIPGSYCECTKGWTKQVFETVLGRPVEVEIEQSIIRGADSCRIRTRIA